jgi:hypothetical protein
VAGRGRFVQHGALRTGVALRGSTISALEPSLVPRMVPLELRVLQDLSARAPSAGLFGHRQPLECVFSHNARRSPKGADGGHVVQHGALRIDAALRRHHDRRVGAPSVPSMAPPRTATVAGPFELGLRQLSASDRTIGSIRR